MLDGVLRDLRGRQRCLSCSPYRPLRELRRSVPRPQKAHHCAQCGRDFVARIQIDGKVRFLHRRRFCLTCSPFAAHNTSKVPPGDLDPNELAAHRRRQRGQTTYRSQKKRRTELKLELITERGGRCADCGYSGSTSALEFHHREPSSKHFAISSASASIARLWSEAAKCDLVCANCHRARHAAARSVGGAPVVQARRRTKQRAVQLLGGRCEGCDTVFPVAAFEFHHRDAGTKEFAISADGVPRRWERIVAELDKCALLCANCHREVHAGARVLPDDGLRGLAERPGRYRTAPDTAMVLRSFTTPVQRIPVSAWSSTSV